MPKLPKLKKYDANWKLIEDPPTRVVVKRKREQYPKTDWPSEFVDAFTGPGKDVCHTYNGQTYKYRIIKTRDKVAKEDQVAQIKGIYRFSSVGMAIQGTNDKWYQTKYSWVDGVVDVGMIVKLVAIPASNGGGWKWRPIPLGKEDKVKHVKNRLDYLMEDLHTHSKIPIDLIRDFVDKHMAMIKKLDDAEGE